MIFSVTLRGMTKDIVAQLTDEAFMDALARAREEGQRTPSLEAIGEMVKLCRSIIFPTFFGNAGTDIEGLRARLGAEVERVHALLTEVADSGTATRFMERLPRLREMLMMDVEATYNGDPAAESYDEIICCYPAIRAITNYRLAHELLELGVRLVPRIITEMAHSETGIDIHPAARIGHHFTIDHGTGVVIGATCIIGNNVKLYQGVTLGAKSFPLDDEGHPIKGIPRHPILEDDVIVYSNATILGRITLGKGTVVGGNLWVTESTRPGERISQGKRKQGVLGIKGSTKAHTDNKPYFKT